MMTLQKFSKYFAAVFLSLFAFSALAQSAAGNWDLTEPSGGPAIGKMSLSSDGSINFDGTIGSWSQSGTRITATVYGSQQLRDAGMPIANLEFTLHGDTMSGSMTNLVNKKTNNIAARRVGAPAAQANNTGRRNSSTGTVGPAPAGTTIEQPCGKPGAINECSNYRPSCKKGEALVDGKCVVPTITCIAPSVLQNGRCVRPAGAVADSGSGNGAGNEGNGNAKTAGGAGRDAKACIVIRHVPQKGGIEPHQSITNTCGEDIGLVFCHGPSARRGTQSTECGDRGRYYQQFTTMHAGQTNENGYSMPPDAEIRYGACFGGESKIKQTTDGNYICK
jgi:hypothetical protein